VDALRYAVLWKTGGISIDADMILLQPITWKTNVITTYLTETSTKIMKFTKGHPFVYACMEKFAKSYNATDREYNGKGIVKQIHKYCGKNTTICANLSEIPLTQLDQSLKIEEYFDYTFHSEAIHMNLWTQVLCKT
jgi:mannosyltransferase OCH1-like enzyme